MFTIFGGRHIKVQGSNIVARQVATSGRNRGAKKPRIQVRKAEMMVYESIFVEM